MNAAEIILHEFQHLLIPGTNVLDTAVIWPSFSIDILNKLLDDSLSLLQSQNKTIIYIQSPVNIVGDIHGNIKDFIYHLKFRIYF